MLTVIAVAALSSLTVGNGIVQVRQLETNTTTISSTETDTITLSSIIQTTLRASTETIETTITQSLLPRGATPTLAILFAAAFLGSAILLVRTRRRGRRKEYCAECGAELGEGEDYCTKCGTKLQLPLQAEPQYAPPLPPPPPTPTTRERRRGRKTTARARPWLCNKCGTENLPEERFCGSCGAPKEVEPLPTQTKVATQGPLPAPKPSPPTTKPWFCTQCGAQNLAEEHFCGNCGTPK